MLKELSIKNFAIVDSITIQLGPGFNVLTGETGVGKSLIVDALNVVLGDRAYRDVIREGSDSARVEAMFELRNGTRQALNQTSAFSIGKFLTLTREIRTTGSSRVWINGQSGTVQQLKALGDGLVDLHGQHEHQYLLNEDHHIGFLDAFAETEAEQESVARAFHKLESLRVRLHTVEMDQTQFRQKQQLYQFQSKEIEDVDPQPDELDELGIERRLLENAQRLNELAGQIVESTPEVLQGLSKILRHLEELQNFDSEAAGYLPEIQSAVVSLGGVSDWAAGFQNKTQTDPGRLEVVHARISRLQHICQKYNRGLSELIAYRLQALDWLKEAAAGQPDKEVLRQKIEQAREEYSHCCQILSNKRIRAAAELSRQIVEKLRRLGIPYAQFEIQVNQEEHARGTVRLNDKLYKGSAQGMDRVAFWMQTNPGETLRPLVRVASGGEISRAMLAIKASLSGRDQISTVIFDEIDSGISGKIARIVGHELANLSRFHQILCITHLPQIASLATRHYEVKKVLTNGRAVTRVNYLATEARIEAIAKLLGTGESTSASLESARELLGAQT